MNQEEKIDIYTIPPNFAEEGTLFSGRVKTRNAVETAVLLMIFLPALAALDLTLKMKIYAGMIVLLPMVILSVIGVQGESLFAFIAGFFRYLKKRRCLSVPDERYRLERNRKKKKAERGGKRGSEKRERRKKKKKKGMETGDTDTEEGTDPGTEIKETEGLLQEGCPTGKKRRRKPEGEEQGGIL